jgi:hypothetical protein
MTKRRNPLIRVTSCLLLLITGLSAQTLQIVDVEGHATTLTAAQISKLPHIMAKVSDHDAPAQFEGVSLASLLSSANIQLGDKLRGPRMTEALLVEAADGYKVVFALAEIDPAFAVREIVLADKRDGKPLDAKEGPFRIVASGDKRPARWIRQVTALKVIAVK